MHNSESRGCGRGSANVARAFAGPASPPPLWTLAVQSHSLKICVTCQARVLTLLFLPAPFLTPALLQHRRRTACGRRTQPRVEKSNDLHTVCEWIPVLEAPEHSVDSQPERSHRGHVSKKKKKRHSFTIRWINDPPSRKATPLTC